MNKFIIRTIVWSRCLNDKKLSVPNPNTFQTQHCHYMHIILVFHAPHQFNGEKKRRYIHNLRTHHINIFLTKWIEGENTKYQCHFGDSFMVRNRRKATATITITTGKIYRSIGMLYIYYTVFLLMIDTVGSTFRWLPIQKCQKNSLFQRIV